MTRRLAPVAVLLGLAGAACALTITCIWTAAAMVADLLDAPDLDGDDE